jgi:hypothetical protein
VPPRTGGIEVSSHRRCKLYEYWWNIVRRSA